MHSGNIIKLMNFLFLATNRTPTKNIEVSITDFNEIWLKCNFRKNI